MKEIKDYSKIIALRQIDEACKERGWKLEVYPECLILFDGGIKLYEAKDIFTLHAFIEGYNIRDAEYSKMYSYKELQEFAEENGYGFSEYGNELLGSHIIQINKKDYYRICVAAAYKGEFWYKIVYDELKNY